MNIEIDQNWETHEGRLSRTFEFKTYSKTIMFVNAVAWLANKLNHHPDMVVSFKKCVVSMTTHDVGNSLTEKDYDLARKIDLIL